MNANPIRNWSGTRFWLVFGILSVLSIAAPVAITMNDAPLKRTCTRHSAALEYIASPSKASNIVTDWKSAGVIADVDRGIFIDFFFILFYSTWLALTVFRCGGAVPLVDWWDSVAERLGWWMWIAGALDVIENLGMLAELHAHAYFLAPLTAFVMALKWTLIATGALYILFTIVLYLRVRAAGDDPELLGEISALRLEEAEEETRTATIAVTRA